MKELVDRNILTLIENWQPPPVKGPRWDDNAYCKYHQCKIGHTTKNCQRLKHDIHNLIDNGKLTIDGVNHATNNDRQAYKGSLPKYEKCESSKNGKGQVNYTYSNQNYGYSNVDNFVDMVTNKENDKDLNHPHNLSLHIEVMIHKTLVRCVLIDGGVGLNICTFSILENLGYSKQDIDTR